MTYEDNEFIPLEERIKLAAAAVKQAIEPGSMSDYARWLSSVAAMQRVISLASHLAWLGRCDRLAKIEGVKDVLDIFATYPERIADEWILFPQRIEPDVLKEYELLKGKIADEWRGCEGGGAANISYPADFKSWSDELSSKFKDEFALDRFTFFVAHFNYHALAAFRVGNPIYRENVLIDFMNSNEPFPIYHEYQDKLFDLKYDISAYCKKGTRRKSLPLGAGGVFQSGFTDILLENFERLRNMEISDDKPINASVTLNPMAARTVSNLEPYGNLTFSYVDEDGNQAKVIIDDFTSAQWRSVLLLVGLKGYDEDAEAVNTTAANGGAKWHKPTNVKGKAALFFYRVESCVFENGKRSGYYRINAQVVKHERGKFSRHR